MAAVNNSLNILVEAKKEYLHQMVSVMSPMIIETFQDLYNDEDLLEELAELDALELEEAVLSTPATIPAQPALPQTVFSLPSAPTAAVHAAASAETEDERALRELANMMA
jgi:hypothetical protein